MQEGFDPREFSMLAYGGAGPMFVPLVAREMDVREVIVPQAPAGHSAWGMLMTDLVQKYSETCVGLLEHVGVDNLRGITHRLARQANADLDRGGLAPADRTIEYTAALRYFRQNTRSIRRWRRATISKASAGVSTPWTGSGSATP